MCDFISPNFSSHKTDLGSGINFNISDLSPLFWRLLDCAYVERLIFCAVIVILNKHTHQQHLTARINVLQRVLLPQDIVTSMAPACNKVGSQTSEFIPLFDNVKSAV